MKPISRTLLGVAAALLLSSGCYAQGLERRNLLGVHVMTVTLKSGATLEEFESFYVREVIPGVREELARVEGIPAQVVLRGLQE